MTATALRAGRDSVAADAVAPARAPDCAATALPALAALIEGLPDPVWLVDAAGLHVLAANAAPHNSLMCIIACFKRWYHVVDQFFGNHAINFCEPKNLLPTD